MRMVMPQKSRACEAAGAFTGSLCDSFAALPPLSLDAFSPASTALFLVDMVEGFARQGPMASRRVEALISPIARLAEACARRKIPVVAFADAHAPDSLEFASFPPHCLRGTAEAALCPEIAQAAPVTLLEKNSTNGFVEPVFDFWRRDNAHIDTYLVAGDCTDICVQQFVVTVLAHGIARNHPLRIVVPLALIDTYDGDGHPADVLNLVSLYTMRAAGAELCADIVWEKPS